MVRKVTCIECPKGCSIDVHIENETIRHITGNLCAKGEQYAHAEVDAPERILTSTVLARGLSLQFVPVRSDKPIPKEKIFEAMRVIHGLVISSPLKTGSIILPHFVNTEANLIVTRDVL
jgi:CxxC motif-containing protein